MGIKEDSTLKVGEIQKIENFSKENEKRRDFIGCTYMMIYNPASPRRSTGKSYIAEIETTNILTQKDWRWGGNQRKLTL